MAACVRGPPAPRTRSCRPARSRSMRPTSRCWDRRPNCPCRCSVIRNIRRRSGSNIGSLDLRRERLHRNIMKRGAIINSLRRRMREQGFFEFQTPILTASSPEGARDYLVPSRLHPGRFYALPQAPQQFKQLTMISGFNRSSRSLRVSATRTRAPIARPASSINSISR